MTEKAKRCVDALRIKCHEQNGCSNCAAKSWCMPPNNPDESLTSYAADLIESLSAELEQVKRERDAAVEQMSDYCTFCIHYDEETDVTCYDCKHRLPFDEDADKKKNCWQWRGVKEENDE